MRYILLVSALVLAAGCASVERPAAVTESAPPSYLAQLRNMNEAALAAEAADERKPAEMREMASFLHSMAVERRRLRESAAAANAKLRDERRVAEAQKQRADTLQQKIDALSEIEKSLSERQVKGR